MGYQRWRLVFRRYYVDEILIGEIKDSESLYNAVYMTFLAYEQVRTLLHGRCGGSGDDYRVARTHARIRLMHDFVRYIHKPPGTLIRNTLTHEGT